MDENILDDYQENNYAKITLRTERIKVLESIIIMLGGILFFSFLMLLFNTLHLPGLGFFLFIGIAWLWMSSPALYALQWRYYSQGIEKGEISHKSLI